jgi:excisionase family DNA binding protein
MSEIPTVETLLTADDVCALLKVKKSRLYDTVEHGLITPLRLGKQLRFRPAAITRYLDQCEHPARRYALPDSDAPQAMSAEPDND